MSHSPNSSPPPTGPPRDNFASGRISLLTSIRLTIHPIPRCLRAILAAEFPRRTNNKTSHNGTGVELETLLPVYPAVSQYTYLRMIDWCRPADGIRITPHGRQVRGDRGQVPRIDGDLRPRVDPPDARRPSGGSHARRLHHPGPHPAQRHRTRWRKRWPRTPAGLSI